MLTGLIGGVIAVGLGLKKWSLELCMDKFIRLSKKSSAELTVGWTGWEIGPGPGVISLASAFKIIFTAKSKLKVS
jgi:hypothetical protein